MNEPALYEIQVQGELGEQWGAWFAGLTVIARQDGTTVLQGALPDQAALHGVLAQMRDLGLPLLELKRVAGCSVEAPGRTGELR
jgi:hypothetical protein